jgi:CDP-glucose 4,6-dehydratase
MENLAISLNNPAFWQDRNVFVTGATGLVGGWVVKNLKKLNANVVTLVRDWVPGSLLNREKAWDYVNVVRGDICDQDLLERVLAEYEISTVLHLAAQTIVPIANRNPVSTFEANIAGTWRLLEACRHNPTVKQIVVASSDKAYGEAAHLPYTEETPLQAKYPYDVSKSCADLIAQSYANTWDLPVVITRCGNFYGGGDLNWNRIIPGTIRSVLRGKRPQIRSTGELIRDYVYVEDAVSSYLLLAEKVEEIPSIKGQAFNFSNENPLSALEIAQKLLDLMGSNLKLEILGEASQEIKNQFLDATKAKTVLNWKPLFSLEEGLKRTISWYDAYFQHANG